MSDDNINNDYCKRCSAHLYLKDDIESNPTIPSIIHLNKPIIILGRQKAKVDIAIASTKYPYITSRVHCKLEQDIPNTQSPDISSDWKIIDLKSLNGIIVNDIIVEKCILKDNDIIALGGKKDKKQGDKVEKIETDIIYTFKINPNFSFLTKRNKLDDLSPPPSSKHSDNDLESQEIIIKQKDDEINLKEKELKEKEESLKKVQESFHSQIVNIQTELQSKDEENQKLRNLVELNRKERLKSSTDFEDDLNCIVCLDIFIEPYTLACSHTVCGECLEKWTKLKKVCPTCREPIITTPTYSRTIHNVITKFIAGLSDDKKDGYNKRVQVLKQTEELRYTTLKTMIARANANRSKFLLIQTPWRPNEKQVFAKGVICYSGRCRELYCSTTGLTKQFLRTASVNLLRIALNNIGILFNTEIRKNYKSDKEYLVYELNSYMIKRFPTL